MSNTFLKKDLMTGDIVVERNGDRGVVILEKDCIVYQNGGLDELDIFTEDLFIDGQIREGDIFEVYRDPDGPIGFTKLLGIEPIFKRKNNKETKKRAAELDALHDPNKGRVRAIVLEPMYRRYNEVYIKKNPDDKDIDIMLGRFLSMVACGQTTVDKAFEPVPDTENLYFLYDKNQNTDIHQEIEDDRSKCSAKELKSSVIIPEKDIRIYGRVMIIRMDGSGMAEDLREEDFEKTKAYLNQFVKA